MVKRLARYHPRHQTHQAPCEFDRPLFPAGHALLARRPRGPVARLYRKAARYGAVIGSQHVAVGAFGHVAIRHAFADARRHRWRRHALLRYLGHTRLHRSG